MVIATALEITTLGEAKARIKMLETMLAGAMDACQVMVERGDKAEEQCEEMERIFELQRKRERPWIDRWREETGKHDCLPDYGEMLGWIIGKADAAEAALRLAERIGMEASLTISDEVHYDDSGCRFNGAGNQDGGSDGVTCFACRVQDLLATMRFESLMEKVRVNENRTI